MLFTVNFRAKGNPHSGIIDTIDVEAKTWQEALAKTLRLDMTWYNIVAEGQLVTTLNRQRYGQDSLPEIWG